jgi:hypothetical protein
MEYLFLLTLVIVVLLVIAVLEVLAAVLPMLIVVLFVPPAERFGLAALLAAADSSARLRLWPALRLAVIARRRARSTTTPPH